ncbi:MAG: hypothetical protein HY778_09920 [Betaproteobacteria bacterium]|nr:hypothetical protein [Betaproteobacteria bacterium]
MIRGLAQMWNQSLRDRFNLPEELKNAADENATIWSAFQQFQTYKAKVPTLFAPNALLAVSDGVEVRVGALTAGREWFRAWRTISGHLRVKGAERVIAEAV